MTKTLNYFKYKEGTEKNEYQNKDKYEINSLEYMYHFWKTFIASKIAT